MTFIVLCLHALIFLIPLQYYIGLKYPLTWTETMSGFHIHVLWLKCETLWWNFLGVIVLYRGYPFDIAESFKHQCWISWAAFSFHSHTEKKNNIIRKVTNNNLLYIIPNTLHSFNLDIWHLIDVQMPQLGKGFLISSLRLLIGNWFHEHLQSDEIIFPICIWNVCLRKHIDLLGRTQSY